MASGYQIRWSKRALKRLANILAYLETRWSEKEIRHFVTKLDRRLELIRKNPETYPFIDEARGVRMSVLTKQTTIYYRDNKAKRAIEIVTLFDNRSKPKSKWKPGGLIKKSQQVQRAQVHDAQMLFDDANRNGIMRCL